MARRRANEDTEGLLKILVFIGFIIFSPLLLFSFIRYKQLNKIYPETLHSQRVFDTGNLTKSFAVGGLHVVLTFFFMAFALGKSPYILAPTILAIAIYLGYKIARSASSNYFGVYIDRENDRAVFPKDLGILSASEMIKLKFITELGEMDEVPLSQIKRITRQAGNSLFIHGRFGSRSLSYSDKQKRDECISAIKDACAASMPIEFEST